jgi:hypothetical protein
VSIISSTANSTDSGFYDFPINQSLRFDGASTLSRTFSSGGNTTTWTWSCWVKRSRIGTATVDRQALLSSGSTEQNNDIFFFYSDTIYSYFKQNDTGLGWEQPTALLRDTNSWYHIVLAIDLNQSASADKIKTYINGVLQTSIGDNAITSSFTSTLVNSAIIHKIGGWFANTYYLDGYLANIQFIDGQALDQYFFGEFKNGLWIPFNAFSTAGSGTATASDGDTATDSYGTNGFRLTFSNASDLGEDSSGNNNDWTVN